MYQSVESVLYFEFHFFLFHSLSVPPSNVIESVGSPYEEVESIFPLALDQNIFN